MTRRSLPRAWLLLARISNLPTVWTNVLAGVALTGATVAPSTLALYAAAMSCVYSGGMWMNDACDADADARMRANRPIPNGDVTRRAAFTGAAVLMAAGAALLWCAAPSAAVWMWVALLVLAISYYNVFHKRDVFGPVAMGICRGLLYTVAAAAATGLVAPAVWIGAAVLTIYVAAFTLAGKSLGARAGRFMPWLIAGISLVDAVVAIAIGHASPMLWMVVGVTGFVMSRAFQRVVPGT